MQVLLHMAFQGTEIPCGFYIVGDIAYTLSSTLLVPYSGAVKKKKMMMFSTFTYLSFGYKLSSHSASFKTSGESSRKP
jgi:hypothetical protein